MIMKKMIFSVAAILFLGVTTTICAQEPEKKDTTKTETPAPAPKSEFALTDEPVKKDTTKTETPAPAPKSEIF